MVGSRRPKADALVAKRGNQTYEFVRKIRFASNRRSCHEQSGDASPASRLDSSGAR
jgi:hypothetical protein